MKASDLFELPESLACFREHFSPEMAPWEWVGAIKQALAAFDFSAVLVREDVPPGLHIEGAVYLHPSVKLPPFGSITGPAWIGEGCELRPGVFIRGNVIAGARCVLGNSCEYKNSLLLDGVQSPHYNYVGDSVLGNKAHLGAGVILSNLRFDQRPVRIARFDNKQVDTGMRKLGGLIGDEAEVGCNAVLQPGCILGRRSVVVGSVAFNGTLLPEKIAYIKQTVTTIPRKH